MREAWRVETRGIAVGGASVKAKVGRRLGEATALLEGPAFSTNTDIINAMYVVKMLRLWDNFMYVCMCECIYINIYVLYIHIYMHTQICVKVVYICIFVYIYIIIYVHNTYTKYIHIYCIYIYFICVHTNTL